MGLLGFRRPRTDEPVRGRIAAWTRAAGGFAEDVVVKVSEIACADPACPGFETVILVQVPGRPTRALKIRRSAAEVTAEAVAEALRNADSAGS
ncbi:hypothetical protein MMB17_24775 [Methylobacterium organophilum]|uniref:hypothetical protein n=1 Tax=Methylobacterium organophilum TaxID=410 RepID=UPI001F13202F|nr:hypothetical protein [Methylobacterium organophilum]UMY17775.1 hypothetical protein MMB17_24775 [Methylobacterium organophilum]